MTYQKVARVSEIVPGQSTIVEVDGELVAIFNVGGSFHAVINTCPHQGGPLGEGFLEDDVVTCPWHGWKFNVKTGESPVVPGVKIDTLPLKIEGEDIFISLK